MNIQLYQHQNDVVVILENGVKKKDSFLPFLSSNVELLEDGDRLYIRYPNQDMNIFLKHMLQTDEQEKQHVCPSVQHVDPVIDEEEEFKDIPTPIIPLEKEETSSLIQKFLDKDERKSEILSVLKERLFSQFYTPEEFFDIWSPLIQTEISFLLVRKGYLNTSIYLKKTLEEEVKQDISLLTQKILSLS